ncbi:hypothetical protein Tco_1505298 [Tanacetum coccineum]
MPGSKIVSSFSKEINKEMKIKSETRVGRKISSRGQGIDDHLGDQVVFFAFDLEFSIKNESSSPEVDTCAEQEESKVLSKFLPLLSGDNINCLTRYVEFLEKNLISQEASGRTVELEEIQDEDTSPSKNTSENLVELDGFEPPQED